MQFIHLVIALYVLMSPTLANIPLALVQDSSLQQAPTMPTLTNDQTLTPTTPLNATAPSLQPPTPAPTTLTLLTPKPTTVQSSPTSTYTRPPKHCDPVTVVGDAIFCVLNGFACRGIGPIVVGSDCPRRGHVAIHGCHKTFKSYVEAKRLCVAPVDATCQQQKNGYWGCVWAVPLMF